MWNSKYHETKISCVSDEKNLNTQCFKFRNYFPWRGNVRQPVMPFHPSFAGIRFTMNHSFFNENRIYVRKKSEVASSQEQKIQKNILMPNTFNFIGVFLFFRLDETRDPVSPKFCRHLIHHLHEEEMERLSAARTFTMPTIRPGDLVEIRYELSRSQQT